MAGQDDAFVTIPSMIKHKTPKDHSSILATSIENEDLSYIQEFLLASTRADDIASLSFPNKEKLIILLTEFLDGPLRVDAMETIYTLLCDAGHVERLSKKLIERSNDFNKLIFLKAKVDYLAYLNRAEEEGAPQNEYTE
ncbi:hypothetical protein PAPHI01_1601 [Pancytospora philotis]|nr:hypothetical protein PAPHI01_1601 [Pancytospora philotis]